MDPDKPTPAQTRVLDAIRAHGPISEADLAFALYGDHLRTAPLQLPLVALWELSLILPAGRHVPGESKQWRAYGQPS